MKTLKSRIQPIIDKIKQAERPVFLFGNTFDNYEIIKTLINNQIYPKGIITTWKEVKENKKLYGIDLYTYEQVIGIYKSNSYIFVNKMDYKIFGKHLFINGYQIGKNVFIDCSIDHNIANIKHNIVRFIWSIQRIPHKANTIFHRNTQRIRNLKSYVKQTIKLKYGFDIYSKIISEHEDSNAILVYDYTGLGDVYVMCTLLKENKIYKDNYVLSVIGNGCKRVADLFGIKNVVVLSQKESSYLSHFTRFCGEEYGCHSITPYPAQIYSEIICHSIAGRKINMLDIYKYEMLMLPADAKITYPVLEDNNVYVEELFSKNSLSRGKTVILSPYANTVIGYPLDFWICLSKELSDRGYNVCTNCGPEEVEIPNTVRLSFSLDKAEAVLNYAGNFIALRSGFCDIVCNSVCNKIIIYPVYDIFNSNVYEFCSFKKMGIGKNITEVQWKYDKFNKLIGYILSKIM